MRKPNEIWVDKGSEFYNSFFKKQFNDNIEMYSIYNKGKYVVAERFIGMLKTKIYKHMTSSSKSVYIGKLDDIVNEYNKTYRTITMKPVDVKDNSYIEFSKEVNDKDSKFKVGAHVRISKCKNIFAKGYTPNWSEQVFVIKKLKTQLHGHMLLVILMVKELLEHFMKKNWKKTNQQTFRMEKVIKRKGNKLYVKWKGFDNSFNTWIDKKGVE